MDESFLLAVGEKEYECEFERWGYSYRINVDIDGSKVWFEPDEERNFRAISIDGKMVDAKLLAEVVEKLEEAFR